MTDYNWKPCSDPANANRLRELLEAGREVVIARTIGDGRLDAKAAFVDGVHGLSWIIPIGQPPQFAHLTFLDPDEPAQMRPHTCECICGCTEPTNDDLCADCHVGDIRGGKCRSWRTRIEELEAENALLKGYADLDKLHFERYRNQLARDGGKEKER